MTTPRWMPPPEEIPSLWSDAIVEASQTGRTDVQVFAEMVALAAVDAYKKSLKPVAWGMVTPEGSMVDCNCRRIEPFTVPLYRLDGEVKA